MLSPELFGEETRSRYTAHDWGWGPEPLLLLHKQLQLRCIGVTRVKSLQREKIWLERWAESPQVATDGPGTQHGAPEGSSFVQNATNVGKQAAGGLKVPLVGPF